MLAAAAPLARARSVRANEKFSCGAASLQDTPLRDTYLRKIAARTLGSEPRQLQRGLASLPQVSIPKTENCYSVSEIQFSVKLLLSFDGKFRFSTREKFF
jgi:hypothetical protein